MIPLLQVAWVKGFWMIEMGAFLALALFLHFLLTRSSRRLESGHPFVGKAVLAPLRLILWIVFGAYALESAVRKFGLASIDPAPLRNAAIVLCAAWFLLRWKGGVEKALEAKRASGKKSPDKTTQEILGKVFTAAIWFIAGLLLLQLFGLNIAPLLAFSGIGAAALGLASKDMISNFYGGLAVYLTRPFAVSDTIELPQRKLTGTVEKIGWYFTTLRDNAKMPFYIPNSVFTTELVVNQSRMTHRYIDESLSFRYADFDKLEGLIRAIRDDVKSHPQVVAELPLYIYVKSFSDSAIKLEIRAYVEKTPYDAYMDIKQQIMLRICGLLHRSGVLVGYPTLFKIESEDQRKS